MSFCSIPLSESQSVDLGKPNVATDPDERKPPRDGERDHLVAVVVDADELEVKTAEGR